MVTFPRCRPPTSIAGRRALLVFARVPRLGSVKTRLAAHIGEESALACFTLMLRRSLSEAACVPARRILALADCEQGLAGLAAVAPEAAPFEVRSQPGGGLGARMSGCIAWAFDTGCLEVVLAGTDVPFLGREILEKAFRALGGADLVLGPSDDGGYYLIGLRAGLSRWRALFEDPGWGGRGVFAATLARAQALGFATALAPTLFDVDTVEDLRRWAEEERDPLLKIHLQRLLQGVPPIP